MADKQQTPGLTGETEPVEKLRVAYDAATRSLADQKGDLESVRNRAGMVLAVVSLVATILAPSFLGAEESLRGTIVSILSFSFFFATVAAAVWVMWPRDKWQFGSDPRKLLGEFVDDPMPEDRMLRLLTEYTAEDLETNQPKIDQLFRCWKWGVISAVLFTWSLLVRISFH